MWKCKKCNGEVIGTVEVHRSLDFKLDEDGNLNGYDSIFELEENIKESEEVEKYYCKCCGESDDDLEEIAIWGD